LKSIADSLLNEIIHEHPRIYELLFGGKPADLSDFQNEMLGESTALVEYFIGEKRLFFFVVKEYGVILKSTPIDRDIDEIVSQFKDHILPQMGRSSDTLVSVLSEMFNILIAPIESELIGIDKLIFVPEGVLGYIPFECLVMNRDDDAELMANHKFLIDEYVINYSYSTSLLVESRKIKYGAYDMPFVGFAPSFEGYKSFPSFDRSQVYGDLRYNMREVGDIHNLMGGDQLLKNAATIEKFKSLGASARIIHLATHGFADDISGDRSYLVFHSDSTGYVRLFNSDLYAMKLESELAVLSACHTGTGELRGAEGIISLARGFMYAGVKSLVTSLWNVDDARTAFLMRQFYKNVNMGYEKDEALRRAKLTFMSEFKHAAHPFYWASFVSIGDNSPLSSYTTSWLPWTSIFAVIVLIIAFLIYLLASPFRSKD
jgi:CHAT domain-containing protein